MAKRKRLKPPALTRFPARDLSEDTEREAHGLETKGNYPFGVAPAPRAPIAQVAGDTATHAALEELADEVEKARNSGRLVLDLALEDVKADHLLRDRVVSDDEDMAALKASLLARGQQTPIEVIALEEGGYGLISGWRRLSALGALHAETGEARFATVQALIKPIETVTESYVAMVEENEIRADLSFYERARLASEAARLGVYPDSMAAVRALFASGSRARRSKINSFVRLYEGFGTHLRFPTHIPEKLGLALVKALEGDAGFGPHVAAALKEAAPDSPEAERRVLERALRPPQSPGTATETPPPAEPTPGITVTRTGTRLVLSGAGVTDALEQDLRYWLDNR